MLGPSGSGQDDHAAADRRLRAPDRGSGLPARRGRHAAAAVRARREHGLPGLRAFPAHDRRRQRRVWADGPEGPADERERRVVEAHRDGPPHRLRTTPPRAALGRAAAARRARASARQPPPRAPARRAPRRARPEAARGDAAGAEGDPAVGRHHVHLRHPRPGGGAHDERPPRRVQPRPDRAGRLAGGVYERPATPLRRRLRRHSNLLVRRRRPRHRRPGRARSPFARRRSSCARPIRRPATARYRRSATSATWSISGRTRAISCPSTQVGSWSSRNRTLRHHRWRRSRPRDAPCVSPGSASTTCPSRTGSPGVVRRASGGSEGRSHRPAGGGA